MSEQATIASTTMRTFLAALAARAPTPGGGAVAAISGATGAALLAMALRYSVKRDEQAPAAGREAIDAADDAIDVMLALADADVRAYADVSRAFATPRSDPARGDAIQRACAGAAAPPRSVAALSAALLTAAVDASDAINPQLASDLGVSADLLLAAAAGGERFVRVNARLASGAADEALADAKRALAQASEAHSHLIAQAATLLDS